LSRRGGLSVRRGSCFEWHVRDANGVPRQWIQKIRRAMATLVPQFNTWRMVQDYATKYYVTK
jgi:starch phosphorylase